MINLLRAEFSRLFKSLIFKLTVFANIILPAVFVWERYFTLKFPPPGTWYSPDIMNANNKLLESFTYIPFVLAVFVGFFIGNEFQNNVLRNKLAVGNHRINVFLSKVIVCNTATVVFALLNILSAVTAGELSLGITYSHLAIIKPFLLILVAMIALTTIYVFIAMLSKSKTGAVVTLFLLSFALFMLELKLYNMYDMFVFENGVDQNGMPIIEMTPNWMFDGSFKHRFLFFINKILPISHLTYISPKTADYCAGFVLPSCITETVLFTLGGCAVFNRAQLK